ncbi:hypothetical protein [Streptomyces decoyicus]|uniref:hypothetical protein n=1 Tax=Streptomyces decoyicus TaxID=249567 RepID=UPI0036501E83
MGNDKRQRRALQRAVKRFLPKPRRPQMLMGEARTGKVPGLDTTHAQFDTSAVTSPATPASRTTEPRPLKAYELASWICPEDDCGRTAVKGTHHWDDRGPYQLLSNHFLECPEGHRWRNSTDGG